MSKSVFRLLRKASCSLWLFSRRCSKSDSCPSRSLFRISTSFRNKSVTYIHVSSWFRKRYDFCYYQYCGCYESQVNTILGEMSDFTIWEIHAVLLTGLCMNPPTHLTKMSWLITLCHASPWALQDSTEDPLRGWPASHFYFCYHAVPNSQLLAISGESRQRKRGKLMFSPYWQFWRKTERRKWLPKIKF